MKETLITALLPIKAFHRTYLEKAIGSVSRQTCPEWRLLMIVEANDRKKFQSLLAEVLADERVELIVNEGRKLAGALNTGMRAAQTDFTAILLGDDMWADTAVEVLDNAIRQHPQADYFHSSRIKIDEEDQLISSVYPSVADFQIEDFKTASPVHHLMCWRREMGLAAGGMDESLNSVGPDDYDFPWTMAEHGATFVALEDCLYLYRDHRDCFRLTTHQPLSHHRREIARIMRKHGATQEEIEKKIARGEKTFLRQCLFTSRLHEAWKRLVGYDAKSGWRQTFD